MKKTSPSGPVRIPHVMVTASAGSGKTWQLTNRILRLILAGAPPESIIALTFTRKAAGEFFDAVLGRLARAASDAEAAAQLCRDLEIEPRPPEAFLVPLRALIGRLHQLQFTTIDSFFHRIVGSFPFELGLSGSFSLMDGYQAGRARVQVLEQILRRSVDGRDGAARRNFLQNFKQATYGTEAKSPAADLDGYVQNLHSLYQEMPDAECWGGTALPANLRAWAGKEKPFDKMEDIRRGLAASGAKDASLEAWDLWEKDLAAWSPASAIGVSQFKTIRGNILKSYEPGTRSCGEFNLAGKKIKPGPALALDLGALVELWISREIRQRIELTHGVGKILSGYDKEYDRMVRRSGRLVFGDLPLVIGPVFEGDGARLDLDYRLDSHFDHWLLDEFQDTSRIQWQVLENLIDEVVQDSEGGRSFFCVGDVKQSIYAWRGGDHRLFGQLRQRYRGRIGTETLAVTYRCSGAVVDLVNRVMGGKAIGETLPGAEAWTGVWQEHTSKRPGTGFAAYLEAPEQAEEDGMDPCHWVISQLVRRIDPPGRGLTCAVLTYSNKEAKAVADHLRSTTPYPVILEGEIKPAEDNMLGRLVLAWVKALAHPRDTFAEGWLRSSPLADLFAPGAGDWRAAAWARVHQAGFETALEELLARLGEKYPLDEFHRLRRRQVLDAVRDFENEGSRDAEALAAYLEARALKAPEVPGAIQVMTIFKAKGLGFDVVFVTELLRVSNPMNKARKGPMIGRDDDHKPHWLLFPPTTPVLGLVPELKATAAAGVRENVYEQLCLLYVALTRAKEALYLVGEGKVTAGESVCPQHVLRAALLDGAVAAGLDADIEAKAVFGDMEWFDRIRLRPVVKSVPPSWNFRFGKSADREEASQVPSGLDGNPPALRDLLSPARRTSRRAGNRVHALFARIRHADDPVPADGAEADEVRACLSVPEIRGLFPADGEVRTWCERAFQVAVGGRWIRGVFDRVVIRVDAAGKPVRAVLVDFKTDAAVPGDEPRLAAKHLHQMEAYREALAVLLDLDRSRIEGCLVSVPLRAVVPVF